MAAITQSSLVSSISISKFKPFLKTHKLHLPLLSRLSLSTTKLSIPKTKTKKSQNWIICAAPDEALPSVYVKGDGTATVISGLLVVAFIVLSVLTVGVIYLAVTDFVTKREKEKYEKEETAKKKKAGKKGKVRARAGPKGFGQKFDQDDVFYD